MWYESLIDRGILPRVVLRYAIKYGLGRYARIVERLTEEGVERQQFKFRADCLSKPIAIDVEIANLQHYELPDELTRSVLGSHLKYSGSFWNEPTQSLNQIEFATLEQYDMRAEVKSGQSILDIGAGWGALTLYLAKKYPESVITALTNSLTQKNYIEKAAVERNLHNIKVVKEDIARIDFEKKFDRIFAIEIFEHTRNAKSLFEKISSWMNPESKLFFQVFSHKKYPQIFDDVATSWMAKHYFTSGMMPYVGFYDDIQNVFRQERQWYESGIHYHKTLEFWLKNLDQKKPQLLKRITNNEAKRSMNVQINRFELFILICSELFRYNSGQDWHLMNYLYAPRQITDEEK